MHTKVGKAQAFAKAMLLPINPAGIVILGVYTVVWGIWVANPFWSVFGQAQLYSALAAVAPEMFWGLFAIVCGTLTCYGAFTRHPDRLLMGAAAAGWHWSMIALFYFIGDILNTGGITSLTFAVYSTYIYLNLKVNLARETKITDNCHHKCILKRK